jgi:rRNA maturation protein Nop10
MRETGIFKRWLAILLIMIIVASLGLACGKAEEKPKYIICPACGGAGQVERPFQIDPDMPVIYLKETCKICGGTGRILSPIDQPKK